MPFMIEAPKNKDGLVLLELLDAENIESVFVTYEADSIVDGSKSKCLIKITMKTGNVYSYNDLDVSHAEAFCKQLQQLLQIRGY